MNTEQRKVGRPIKYPFAEMRIGGTFFVPRKSKVDIGPSCYYWGNKLNAVYTCREVQLETPGVLVRRVG